MEESLWRAAGSAIPGEIQLYLRLLRLLRLRPPLQLRFCRRTPPASGETDRRSKISFAALPDPSPLKAGQTKPKHKRSPQVRRQLRLAP